MKFRGSFNSLINLVFAGSLPIQLHLLLLKNIMPIIIMPAPVHYTKNNKTQALNGCLTLNSPVLYIKIIMHVPTQTREQGLIHRRINKARKPRSGLHLPAGTFLL